MLNAAILILHNLGINAKSCGVPYFSCKNYALYTRLKAALVPHWQHLPSNLQRKLKNGTTLFGDNNHPMAMTAIMPFGIITD
ncbi:hypothetical protein [Filimonas effusa]|uniref:Uncharacterized protein n=1 Tax=Filimonas effusa TaxID=2508721 RepID=A0A4V1MAN8_9BACT|nr:hypothetical protein [Filimonas effusa]RXK86526.1 hypothetical protein ESB13_06895 [Filimonas effusa]